MASVALGIHQAMRNLGWTTALACAIQPDGAADDIGGRPRTSVMGAGTVVHVHGVWTAFEWRSCRWARQCGAALIVSPHGALSPWARRKKWLKKTVAWHVYQRRALDAADLLLVNSREEADDLAKLGLRPPIEILPNGIDVGAFPASNPQQAPRQKVIAYVGRFAEEKGLEDLLHAWSTLQEKHGYSLHLHGFGDAAYVNKLTALERKLELSSFLLGPPVFGKAKWDVLLGARGFVLPSRTESFGLAAAEALFAGLPVVATDAAPWGLLAPEGLGWSVPADPSGIAEGLKRLMGIGDDQLVAMGRRAHAYAASHFLWPEIAQRYRDICDRVTASRVARAA